MEDYKNILLAIALNPETDALLVAAAKEIQEKTKAGITLVHAVEYVSIYGGMYGVPISAHLEEQLLKNAQIEMGKVGKKLSVPKKNQIVKLGIAKNVILEEAENNNSDLIVVGSHGRHGIQILLGSTSNAVLHHAKCDVLSVRVKE